MADVNKTMDQEATAAKSARPILVFDTSAMNKFAKESDSTPVLAGVFSGYTVRITGTTLW